mmetsp:Transcript_11899/g.36061  ORF Transcript_11899/g.36061 Transcript_11899/m.36061 type:complete len:82 (-) Transcript_11899:45-290(-)
MLPKNKLRKDRISRLLLYPGPAHPHTDEIGDSVPINQIDLEVLEEYDLEQLERDTTMPRRLRKFDELKEYFEDAEPTKKDA